MRDSFFFFFKLCLRWDGWLLLVMELVDNWLYLNFFLIGAFFDNVRFGFLFNVYFSMFYFVFWF